MPHAILDGLSLVDPIGRAILASTIVCLLLAIAANLFVRARYLELERDLRRGAEPFAHAILNDVIDDALAAAARSSTPNTQAIIEARFQSELRPLLAAERFVRAATGLVIILGLFGTFYGLTLSIGRIVQLVSSDSVAGADVAGAVTAGLTHALSGMAVAFANSLLGIVSAVILTILGVISNVTDRRVALMLELETHLDRRLASTHARGDVSESVARLDNVVTRFESALETFAASTSGFIDFNAHLKDNIQRMSLSLGDFSDSLKVEIATLKGRNGR